MFRWVRGCGFDALTLLARLTRGALDIVTIAVCALSIDTGTALGTGDTGAWVTQAFAIFTVLTGWTGHTTTGTTFAWIGLTFAVDTGFGIITSDGCTGRNTISGATKFIGVTSFSGTRVIFAQAIDAAFSRRATLEIAVIANALSA